MPKSGNPKGLILAIVLILLIIGMGYYVFFANDQIKNAQRDSSNNTTVVIPTVTAGPTTTPATVDEVKVSSPDADINDVEKDTQGL
jgi:flagellar basal body-associated protein FliL